jgi:hypothetical protein
VDAVEIIGQRLPAVGTPDVELRGGGERTGEAAEPAVVLMLDDEKVRTPRA